MKDRKGRKRIEEGGEEQKWEEKKRKGSKTVETGGEEKRSMGRQSFISHESK